MKSGMKDLMVDESTTKPRRGLNTMGLFAVLAAFATLGTTSNDSGLWIVLLIVTFALIIWAFAEAIVHYVGFITIILALAICAIAIYARVIETQPQLSEQNTASVVSVSPAPSPTPLTVDSLKNLCEEIPYKSILRNPEDYTARYITVTLEISQVIKSGWLDEKTYYRCYTDDGSGLYWGNEYYIVDYRPSDAMKLLDGDVIQVYGQVLGIEEVTRALTRTDDEVVSIAMLYSVLISE